MFCSINCRLCSPRALDCKTIFLQRPYCSIVQISPETGMRSLVFPTTLEKHFGGRYWKIQVGRHTVLSTGAASHRGCNAIGVCPGYEGRKGGLGSEGAGVRAPRVLAVVHAGCANAVDASTGQSRAVLNEKKSRPQPKCRKKENGARARRKFFDR